MEEIRDKIICEADEGKFQWKKRMGIHYAYHTNRTNRYFHWFMIPIELLGVICLLASISLLDHDPLQPWGTIPSTALICIVGVIYCRTDVLCGITFWLLLLGLQAFACAILFPSIPVIANPGWQRIIFSLAIFIVSNWIQTRIGHGRFEPEGRDDTNRNIEEFLKTRKPVPLFLIFYYHWVEIWLILGYKPSIKKDILFFRDQVQFPQNIQNATKC